MPELNDTVELTITLRGSEFQTARGTVVSIRDEGVEVAAELFGGLGPVIVPVSAFTADGANHWKATVPMAMR